jgi:tight adherence protein B
VIAWSLLVFFFITFLVIAIALVVAWLALQQGAVQNAEESLDDNHDPVMFENLLKGESMSSIALWHTLLARFDLFEIMKRQIAQADLAWSVGRVTLAMLLCGTVAVAVLSRLQWLPLWGVIGLSWLAALCPYMFILRQRKRRFRKFQEAFPDALDSLSRALRAGYTLVAALEMVANESAPPVSTEIRKTFVEANLGMPWDQALSSLGERMPLTEVNLFVAAVQIHSRTGGRLSDVIGRLTDTMRDQNALNGEVRAIAAHGKLTGWILTLVPVGIATMMLVVSPDYIGVLIAHPYGKQMIAGAIGCLVLAHFVMKKMVDIKV